MLRSLSLAQHGGMARPQFALDAFLRHYNSVGFARKGEGGFRVLELGPGDSLFSAVIAKALGASHTCLVDVGPFARTELSHYRQMAEYLARHGLKPPDLCGARRIEDVLAICGAEYRTRGLRSLKELPARSFEFIFSNGVLQHVWRSELPDTLDELRRLVHPGGATSHSVDLRDTMGHSLHHLRFSQRVWESDWFRSAGFYTNRLRLSELVGAAQRAGFAATLPEVNRWRALPVRRDRLAAPYRSMPDDELLPATVRMDLVPVAQAKETEAVA
jgi:SAM-dependent methyltransferase